MPIVVTPDNVKALTKDLPMVAQQAFLLAIRFQHGRLDVELPDGRTFRCQGDLPGPEAIFIVKDWGFAKRLASQGDIGIAEAYLREEWDSPNVTDFLQLFCANQHIITSLLEDRPFVRLWQKLRHWMNRNSKSGSRRNIHAHYDLGNSFYASWLDTSMTYSSGVFAPGDNDLRAAQDRKYRQLMEETQIGADHHVLEIGCGWGGFAEFAAREAGCKVTALTISLEQFNFAKKRMFEAGLNEKVEIKLQDYRDERGIYDRIASIEMFEAVGEQYWQTYFGQLRDRLNSGGIAGLQVITIQDQLFDGYRREIDFIRRYVFPGGMLPSPTIMRSMGEKFGFSLATEKVFGHDYAVTLAHWRDRFRSAWPDMTNLGFDERFRRLWEYYLAYCEAGFKAGSIDVRQLVYVKNG
ncbi:MAG: cyclopropane-fatty-acyl-phospholipid synthase family protein [Beijerinckiaceae bacterium]|nr:cyclopropane-fatty-acyl-phospholipid synthase family protein [Beijerinckiaceae bacterium]